MSISKKKKAFKKTVEKMQRDISELNRMFQKGMLSLSPIDGHTKLVCAGNNMKVDVYFLNGLQEGEEIETWKK